MFNKPPQYITLAEAITKMERYCAYQERCHKDVENKLKTLKLIDAAKEKIIVHLLSHDFLNEERFAKSYARGKFNIKKWGKSRITQELRIRNISSYNIKSALKEISDSEYISTFDILAQKKYDSLVKEDKNKMRKKLMSYLMYRGWEAHRIYEKINELIPY